MIRCGHKNCNACNTCDYELTDIQFLYRFLATHGDSLFIDVGAHVGLYVHRISEFLRSNERYTSDCSMLSIEPDMSVVQQLQENTAPNPLLTAAAWSTHGSVQLIKEGRAHGNVTTKITTPADGVVVVALPIDYLTSQVMHVTNIIAIKIDVEGAEGHVILGTLNTLGAATRGALVVELSKDHLESFDTDVNSVIRQLHDVGFEPANDIQNDDNQISDVHEGQMRNVHFTKG